MSQRTTTIYTCEWCGAEAPADQDEDEYPTETDEGEDETRG